MKVIFGQLSIGCFIVFLTLLGCYIIMAATSKHPCAMDGFWLFPFVLLSFLFGLTFAIIGTIKKELPKKQWVIALLLHSGVVLMVMLMVMVDRILNR